MSQNQSRAEGNQSAQNRKFSRSRSFNQQRHVSGNGSNKGGEATALTSSGRGQSRAGTVSSDSNSSSEARATQNGGNQRQQNSGIYNAPVSSTSANFKPANAPPQKITQAVPRGPSSNVSTVQSHVSAASSDFKAPTTPAKGDTSDSFPQQFGSISPGLMNGIQIPARTSSAPPKLDEQKRDQARHDSFRATLAMPTPSIPKQQLPKKDAGVSDQPNAGEARSVSKLRRDAQVSSAPPLNQVQRPSVHPMPGMSMQIPFHQPHVPVQFGGPNPQIQSQAMTSTSLPRSNPNVPPQAQPIPSFFPNHPMNYYPNSYNSSSVFFLAPSSVPMNNTQAPQPPRFYNQVKQVTVKPLGVSHGEKDPSPSASLLSVGKGEYLKPSRPHGEHSVGPQKGVESSSSISLQQSKPGLGTSSTIVPMESEEPAAVSGPVTVESALLSTSSVTGTIDVSASLSTNSAEEAEKEAVVGPVSIKDKQKKTGNRDQLDQVGKQSSFVSSLPSQLQKPEPGEAEVTSFGAALVLEAAKASLLVTTMAASESVEGNTNGSFEVLDIESTMSRQSRPEKVGINEQGVVKSSESSKPDKCSLETSLKSPSLKPSEIFGYNKESSSQEVTSTSCGGCSVETAEEKLEESSRCCFDDARVADGLVTPTWVLDGANAQSSVSVIGVSAAHYDRNCTLDASFCGSDSIDPKETTVTNSARSSQEFAPISIPSPSAGVLKHENEDTENISSSLLPSSPGIQVKAFSESVVRSAMTRAKKKKRDLYRKAKAAGTSSDLYMAHKGPEEREENVTSAESAENTTREGTKQTSNNVTQNNVTSNMKPSLSKAEPDDWEDAVDISTTKLETIKNESEINGADDNGLTTKRYSHDFLLKFAAQCTDLPQGFEVTSDIDDALLVSGDGVLRDSHPSPGRNIDRSIGGSRSDRRGNAMRGKLPGPLI